jgi:8-oxo-dGTP diphosphatase
MSCADALAKPRPESPHGLKIVLVAAAALVDPQNRILIAQRPEGKSMAGLWEFPGGKVNEGELPEFALMRELGRRTRHRNAPHLFSARRFRLAYL